MFTGIVHGCYPVRNITQSKGFLQFSIELPDSLLSHLFTGDSIAVNGVCLTVTKIDENQVFFDVMSETLRQTTLATIGENECVNVERSVKFGDDIGGHIVSGHVAGIGKVIAINTSLPNQREFTIECPKGFMKYIFNKGFIALDGASLTVCNPQNNSFQVCLIPETLQRTSFANKSVGDLVNIEFDHHTQIIVDTVRKTLAEIA